MKDEIKEILESSRKIINSNRENGFDRIIMLGDDIDKILDYITNLQEENEILKELNICVGCENNPDYKLRCEKAIEYIKEWQSFPHTNGSTHNELKNLLNILNGGDEE